MSARASLLVFGIVLLAFTAYTAVVVAGHGYTGFLTLAMNEPWGGQMFVDLVIALLLFAVWMHADAAGEGREPGPRDAPPSRRPPRVRALRVPPCASSTAPGRGVGTASRPGEAWANIWEWTPDSRSSR